MKGNSDITATAISDAALICVYLTMTLSKAALKRPPAHTGTKLALKYY